MIARGRQWVSFKPITEHTETTECFQASARFLDLSRGGQGGHGGVTECVRPHGDMIAAPIAASGTTLARGARMVLCTSRVAGRGNERWGLVCAAIQQ